LSTHVIGAGLAGLAAACLLTECGRPVTLWDSAPAAGGRARSYFDKTLNCRIDNGNHLILSGNTAALTYLQRIGASRSLSGPPGPIFPFVNLATAEHWALRLSEGSFPWWALSRKRRVPGTRLPQYRALLKLRAAKPGQTIASLLDTKTPLYRNFLEPLAISALNTLPTQAEARLLATTFAETIDRGGYASIPRYATLGLTESFIDPALDWLRARGADIRLGRRVTEINPNQPTVLAVPPWVAAAMVPELVVPTEFESICNLHFKATLLPGEAGFWGLTGGMAEWAFARPGIISVTISAANRYAELDNDIIATRVWGDLCRAFKLPAEMPAHRVIWERRATFAATPEQCARRPGTTTANPNLVIAGDWTDTGLPASIEGAIRSGNAAATALMKFPPP